MSNHVEIAGYCIIGGGLLSYKGFRELTEYRMIKNIPSSNIRSVAMGLCEIKGVVCETEEPLTAPLSQTTCVYYKCEIQEYQTRRKRSRWVTIHQIRDGRYFYVKDETGHVLIDTDKADLDISPGGTYSIRRDGDEVTDFLEDQGISYKGLLFGNKKIRVKEYLLYPGKPLYIMGTAQDNPHVEDASQAEGYKDVMIGKGKNQKFFLISEKKEKDLLGAKKLWIAGIFLGPPLIAAGLWILFL